MGLPGVGTLISALGGGPDTHPQPAKANLSGISLAWPNASGIIVAVRFDVVSQETHESLMAITDHPVEVGANVVDNARQLPASISIEGYVSNAPMASNFNMGSVSKLQSVPLDIAKVPLKFSVASLTNALGSAIGDLISPPPAGAMLEKANGDFANRVTQMEQWLTDAQNARVLVTVVSKVRTIDAMLITRVACSRGHADGTGATFHVELKRVRLVSSLTVDAPSPTEARGMITAAQGSKATKEAPPEVVKVADSILLSMSKAAGLQK